MEDRVRRAQKLQQSPLTAILSKGSQSPNLCI